MRQANNAKDMFAVYDTHPDTVIKSLPKHDQQNPYKIITQGATAKSLQRLKFGTTPSKKSLENKQPGKYKAMQDAKRNKD